jgi:hypothetical protein
MTVNRRLALLACAALLALGGCVSPPRPFTEEFYAGLRVPRGKGPATAVAVFAFADEREGDPHVVLRYEPADARPKVERATVPVGPGVARAFARGLADRGFTVTDVTARRWEPGTPAPAPLVVTGRVADFGVRIDRVGIVGGWHTRAACRVIVEVWDAAANRRVSERTYQRVTEGAMLAGEPLFALAHVLAEVVEQAVTDPGLIATR